METEMSESGPLIIACIISLCGYTLYGAAGFGAAMIFHSLWDMLGAFGLTNGKIAEATYYLNIMTLVVTITMCYQKKDLIQWDLIFACCVPWTIMNVIGSFLLVGTANDILKIILGVVLLIIFIQQSYKIITFTLSGDALAEQIYECTEPVEVEIQDLELKENVGVHIEDSKIANEEQPPSKQPDKENEEEIPLFDIYENWKWILFAGCFGGILSGLFNMPGPCTIIILTFSGIHRERWKANFFTWQIPAQFFVVWFLSDRGGFFRPDMWYWYLTMSIIAIVAGSFGNFMAKTMGTLMFKYIVVSISFAGALSDFTVLQIIKPYKGWIMLTGVGVIILFIIFLMHLHNEHVLKPFKKYLERERRRGNDDLRNQVMDQIRMQGEKEEEDNNGNFTPSPKLVKLNEKEETPEEKWEFIDLKNFNYKNDLEPGMF